MKEILDAQHKTMKLMYEKVYEMKNEFKVACAELEKLISETPTGEDRNRLTEINILFQTIIYENF